MNSKRFRKFEFIDFLIDNGLVSLEPHVMHDIVDMPVDKKGQLITPYYVNFRGFSDNELIDNVVENVYSLIAKKLPTKKIDAYVGVPEGMTSVGVSLSRKYGAKVVIARSKEKQIADTYAKKWFIGLEEGNNVIVLEDVIQTGDMTYDLIKKLREAKANVLGFCALVNRDEKPHPKIVKETGISSGSAARTISEIFKIPFLEFTDIHFLLRRYKERIGMTAQQEEDCINFYVKYGANIYPSKSLKNKNRQMSRLEDALSHLGGFNIYYYGEDHPSKQEGIQKKLPLDFD